MPTSTSAKVGTLATMSPHPHSSFFSQFSRTLLAPRSPRFTVCASRLDVSLSHLGCCPCAPASPLVHPPSPCPLKVVVACDLMSAPLPSLAWAPAAVPVLKCLFPSDEDDDDVDAEEDGGGGKDGKDSKGAGGAAAATPVP